MFRIPYYTPPWNPGRQIVNLGTGGPASHMELQPSHSKPWPTSYAVICMGMGRGGAAMPRQVIGPTKAITPNQYSNPLTINNLVIPGLFKNPTGG